MLIHLLKRHKEILLYIIFGGCTVLINIATYYLFYNVLSLSNVCSNIIAWVVAVLFAFITNKIWVFNSKSFDKKIIVKEIASFTTCRLTTGIIDLIIMYLSVDVFLQNEIIWKIISNIIVIILNYVASKILVFKNIKK